MTTRPIQARIDQARTWLAAIATPIALVAANLPPSETMILIAKGKATHYNPGLMDLVLANRIRWGHLTPQHLAQPHIGYVALRDACHIGSLVWMRFLGTVKPDDVEQDWAGPFLVIDCGAVKDYEYLDRIGFAIDLSYELAVRYNTVGRPIQNVQVWAPLVRSGPIEPVGADPRVRPGN